MNAQTQDAWNTAELEPRETFTTDDTLAYSDDDFEALALELDADAETHVTSADFVSAEVRMAALEPEDFAAAPPIPRIRIHAVSERAELGAVLQQASQDRRMSRVEFVLQPGGVDAAIAHCASNSSPDLLILDTAAGQRELLEKLDRLAEHVDPGTKVLIIGASNDIGFYRELMRRGISEYLVAPQQPLGLIRSIAALYANPERPFAGKVIACVGAKGGVGSSTIAHNLAWLLAERFEANTTIIDLDLPFGTAALDFNQEPQQTVAEALMSPDRVDEVFLDRSLTRQTDRLLLFCAPGSIDKDLDVGPEAYEAVIDTVRRTSPYVVLDLPHLWSPWVRDALVGADEIVIVATPELASLRNTKNLLDRIKAARPLDASPSIVLNMTGMPKRPEIPLKDFADALGVTPETVLPFEPHVFGTAANNGQMIPELAPGSKITASLEALAASLVGREPPVRKKPSLFDRLPLMKR
jgi:pilus assembly protein CpaE